MGAYSLSKIRDTDVDKNHINKILSTNLLSDTLSEKPWTNVHLKRIKDPRYQDLTSRLYENNEGVRYKQSIEFRHYTKNDNTNNKLEMDNLRELFDNTVEMFEHILKYGEYPVSPKKHISATDIEVKNNNQFFIKLPKKFFGFIRFQNESICANCYSLNRMPTGDKIHFWHAYNENWKLHPHDKDLGLYSNGNYFVLTSNENDYVNVMKELLARVTKIN